MTNKDQILYGRTAANCKYFAPNSSSVESNAISEDPTVLGNELKNVCMTPSGESIKIKSIDIRFSRELQNLVTFTVVVNGVVLISAVLPVGATSYNLLTTVTIQGDSLFTYHYEGATPESVITTITENLLK